MQLVLSVLFHQYSVLAMCNRLTWLLTLCISQIYAVQIVNATVVHVNAVLMSYGDDDNNDNNKKNNVPMSKCLGIKYQGIKRIIIISLASIFLPTALCLWALKIIIVSPSALQWLILSDCCKS